MSDKFKKDNNFQIIKNTYTIIPDDKDIKRYLLKLKPFKTYQEQIQILKNRHLIIPNDKEAANYLEQINYYRLTAYALTLKHNDIFYPNVSIYDIVQLYDFDCEFRNFIMKYTSFVEISIRSYISYYHAQKYGPLGYLNSNFFENKRYHTTFISILKESLKNSKEVFIDWHRTDKNGIFPFWVAIEETSFGCVSLLYKNFLQIDRQDIAKNYYGISNEHYIENWLQCAVVARNIAAHGGRFYNRINIRPKVLLGKKLGKIIDNGRPFAFIYSIFRLLPDDKKYMMIEEIKKLFKKYPFAQMRHLGFPSNWEKYLDYFSL